MKNTRGLKELFQNIAKYARRVQIGEGFAVFKASDEDSRWEEVVDFTNINHSGVDVDDVLIRL